MNGASGALSSGTTLQAELTKSIDAKKAKPGDEVTAKLTQDVKADGKVVLHKGSKLVGHVTEAQAKTKENSESKLGVVFDKAVLKGGEEMAFNGAIQALAAPVQGSLSATTDDAGSLGSGMGSGGGTAMGGGRSGGGVGSLGGGRRRSQLHSGFCYQRSRQYRRISHKFSHRRSKWLSESNNRGCDEWRGGKWRF